MLIKKFEDIDTWKESRKLMRMVYELTDRNPFKRDYALKEQIRRATVSCMSNVAEGFDSGTKQQFILMLTYTRRSASEVQSGLYAALDRNYITKNEFEDCYNQAQLVRKLSNGFIRYLKTGNKTNRLTH